MPKAMKELIIHSQICLDENLINFDTIHSCSHLSMLSQAIAKERLAIQSAIWSEQRCQIKKKADFLNCCSSNEKSDEQNSAKNKKKLEIKMEIDEENEEELNFDGKQKFGKNDGNVGEKINEKSASINERGNCEFSPNSSSKMTSSSNDNADFHYSPSHPLHPLPSFLPNNSNSPSFPPFPTFSSNFLPFLPTNSPDNLFSISSSTFPSESECKNFSQSPSPSYFYPSPNSPPKLTLTPKLKMAKQHFVCIMEAIEAQRERARQVLSRQKYAEYVQILRQLCANSIPYISHREKRLANRFMLDETGRVLLDKRSGNPFICGYEEMFDYIHFSFSRFKFGGPKAVYVELKRKYANITVDCLNAYLKACEC